MELQIPEIVLVCRAANLLFLNFSLFQVILGIDLVFFFFARQKMRADKNEKFKIKLFISKQVL